MGLAGQDLAPAEVLRRRDSEKDIKNLLGTEQSSAWRSGCGHGRAARARKGLRARHGSGGERGVVTVLSVMEGEPQRVTRDKPGREKRSFPGSVWLWEGLWAAWCSPAACREEQGQDFGLSLFFPSPEVAGFASG